MQKNKRGNVGVLIIVGFVIICSVLGAAAFFTGFFSQSGTGNQTLVTDGPWSEFDIAVDLQFEDKYSHAEVNPVAYVYSEKPDCWNDFGTNEESDCDLDPISIETSTSGTARIKEKPGMYYVLTLLSEHNTEFIEVVVPNGDGYENMLHTEYNSDPLDLDIPITERGFLTVENITYTFLEAETNEPFDKSELFSVGPDSCVYIEDVIVYEIDESLTHDEDASADDVSHEGVSLLEITVADRELKVIDLPNNLLNDFDEDSNGEKKSFEIGKWVCDKETLKVSVYFKGNVDVSSEGKDDNILGNNEQLAKIVLKDAFGTSQGDVYVQGTAYGEEI